MKDSLQRTELGKVFQTWSDIEYRCCKAMTRDNDWCAFIRQKINNIYSRYCDKDVILAREYMEQIKTPKHLYYNWINGTDMDVDKVTDMIDVAIVQSEEIKKDCQKRKIDLSWKDYKKIIEGFLRRCFENCKTISEYEENNSVIRLDFLTEDHFYVSYISKCLDGEFKKWIKRFNNLPQNSRLGYKYCKSCGALIENTGNRKTYCDNCRRINDMNRYKKYNAKRNHN